MASYTTAQVSADLDFANLDCQVTLTTVSPSSSSGVEFTASQQALGQSFMVEINGREEIIDQKFYLNINGLSTVPSKGWVLGTGGNNYKVFETDKSPDGVMLKLVCINQYQATS
tara:strand:+ start:125 stop:466 length:342 start_codon:yes stop_codon:yes gene_type:complete